MVEEGNYLIPSYRGVPRFQKPPLAYWQVVVGYKIFGIHLWSARLIFLLMACCLLYLTYKMTLLFTDDRDNARFNLFLLASAPMTIIFSRAAMTDLPLTFFLAIVDPVTSERWIIDATPDFREQVGQLNRIHPSPDSPLVSGVFLNHTNPVLTPGNYDRDRV